MGERLTFPFRAKDGHEVWTLMAASSLFDGDGKYAGALAMVTDITAQNAREAESSHLAAIVRSSADSIIGMSTGGVIQSWNEEVTETAAVSSFEKAEQFARDLNAIGCKLALDDFGTGFGSFTYLKHLQARYLKIDVEFVRDLTTNATDQKVVKAIVEIAHSLDMKTIAEGVEDSATLEALKIRGVDFAQGFYVGRPMTFPRQRPIASAAREDASGEDAAFDHDFNELEAT